MSPLDEGDLKKLSEFEKILEKRTDNKMEYLRSIVFSLEERTRGAEAEVFNVSKQLSSVGAKIERVEKALDSLCKKLEDLEEALHDPNIGIFAKQNAQWTHFTNFTQRTSGEFSMNKMEHNEIVEKLNSLETKMAQTSKELDKLKLYSLIGFLILFLNNNDAGMKVIKLLVSLF